MVSSPGRQVRSGIDHDRRLEAAGSQTGAEQDLAVPRRTTTSRPPSPLKSATSGRDAQGARNPVGLGERAVAEAEPHRRGLAQAIRGGQVEPAIVVEVSSHEV